MAEGKMRADLARSLGYLLLGVLAIPLAVLGLIACIAEALHALGKELAAAWKETT